MNLLDATLTGLNKIHSVMEQCPLCGKRESETKCLECGKVIFHSKGQSSIAHTCFACNVYLGKGE